VSTPGRFIGKPMVKRVTTSGDTVKVRELLLQKYGNQ
jgi:hypothetical protein